jgi:transcriptional regulator with XRE-family HTH domain
MPNSLHDPKYILFREMLVKARTDAGLFQSDVAERLNKQQSFVSKVERGDRRIDMPEFLEIADALGIDVVKFIKQYKDALKSRKRLG